MSDDDLFIRRLTAALSEAQDALPPAPVDAVALLRTRQLRARRRRARLASVGSAFLVITVALLTGLVVDHNQGSTSRPSAASAGDADRVIRIWSLRPFGRDVALRPHIEKFNSSSDLRIELTLFSNDSYKQQLAEVLGTPQAPDVFFNWGGGGLAESAHAGQVVDLTEAMRAHPEFQETLLPTVLAGGRVDGRQYGLPMNGMQPSILFYNRQVFADARLQPPKTYAELLTLIDEFKARGITPIALAGAQGWPQLMYLMYLTDRIGGPGKFANILAGNPGAWSDPFVLQAAAMCQELAERGAFGSDFGTIGYDSDTASRRLAAGEAAMHLMGSWEYGNQISLDAGFVSAGGLGWVPFPVVTGGAGDPRNLVGIPANYFSVTAGRPHVDAAVEFLFGALVSDQYLSRLQGAGEVPGVPHPPARPAEKFATFVYQLATDAPSFTLAWDQALSRTVGETLNANVRELFLSRITPEQFVAAMAQAG